MSNKLKTLLILLTFVVTMTATNSCKKETPAPNTDEEMYEMAIATSGFTWFKNSNSLLDKSSGSGHPQPFLRTRYNTIAADSQR